MICCDKCATPIRPEQRREVDLHRAGEPGKNATAVATLELCDPCAEKIVKELRAVCATYKRPALALAQAIIERSPQPAAPTPSERREIVDELLKLETAR